MIDNPIARNESFMALVSKGAIVEGWVLVIPKTHMYSLRKLYCDDEFASFANTILKKIKEIYKKDCIIFEHGASHCDSIVSCGTNHAHLHIVPYNKTLLDEMRKTDLEWRKCHINEIEEIVDEKEYWFYAENVSDIRTASGYIHIIKKPESQFFRKLIAKKEGCSWKFDYKEYAFNQNEQSTYEALKG